MIVNEVYHAPRSRAASRDCGRAQEPMLLLPYGIPIALGTIAYFIWAGMLI